MPGLKGIQNGTEFFWLKWFQKIIGGSYIIAFHSEITAGSDKNRMQLSDCLRILRAASIPVIPSI